MILRADELTDEHFGKTLHFEENYLGRHYVSHGEITMPGNELPYFWSKHSSKPYKMYKDRNREEPEDCWFEDCDQTTCWDYVPGPLVVLELDDDEMLELQPYDEVEIVD